MRWYFGVTRGLVILHLVVFYSFFIFQLRWMKSLLMCFDTFDKLCVHFACIFWVGFGFEVKKIFQESKLGFVRVHDRIKKSIYFVATSQVQNKRRDELRMEKNAHVNINLVCIQAHSFHASLSKFFLRNVMAGGRSHLVSWIYFFSFRIQKLLLFFGVRCVLYLKNERIFFIRTCILWMHLKIKFFRYTNTWVMIVACFYS